MGEENNSRSKWGKCTGFTILALIVLYLLRIMTRMGNTQHQTYDYEITLPTTTTTGLPIGQSLDADQDDNNNELFDSSVDPCQDFSRYTCPKHFSKLEVKREVATERSKKIDNKKGNTALPMPLERRRRQHQRQGSNAGNTAATLPDAFTIHQGGGQRQKRSGIELEKQTETEKIVLKWLEMCDQQHANLAWKYDYSIGNEEEAYLRKMLRQIFQGTWGPLELEVEEEAEETSAKNSTNSPPAGERRKHSQAAAGIWEAIGRMEQHFETVGPFFALPRKDPRTGLKTLSIYQTSYTIPREYFIESQYSLRYEIYRQIWTDSTETMLTRYRGLLENGDDFLLSEDFKGIADEYEEIFTQLAAMLEPVYYEEGRNVSSGKFLYSEKLRKGTFTLSSLARQFPAVEWRAYFKGLGLASLNQSTVINMANLDYMGRLNKFVASLSLKSLKNYAIIALIKRLQSLRDVKTCEQFMDYYMPHGKGFTHMRGYVDELERDLKVEAVKEMVLRIIGQYGTEIEKSKWMTAQTKKALLNKLNKIEMNVGWPRWYELDATTAATTTTMVNGTAITTVAAIDRFHHRYLQEYGQLRLNFTAVDDDDQLGTDLYDQNQVELWKMVLALNRAHSLTQMEGLGLPTANEMEQMAPTEFNAEYEQDTNTIQIAYNHITRKYPDDTNDPLFDLAQRYGQMGMTLAHELGHGFDPIGVFYGASGELALDLLDANSSLAYAQRQRCMIELYSGGCCPEQANRTQIFHRQCEDGLLTIRENFADVSGLTVAYRTFRQALKEAITDKANKLSHGYREYEQKLSDANVDQLIYSRQFWQAHAAYYCTAPGENEELEKSLLNEPHSIEECRVRIAVKTVPEFGRDFKCTKDKNFGQNAAQKCNLWS